MEKNKLVSRLIRSVLGKRASVDDVSRISTLVDNVKGAPRLPERGESAAFAPRREKTAALCYDRAWGVGSSFPSDIAFSGDSDVEIRYHTLLSLLELVVFPSLATDDPVYKSWTREYSKLIGNPRVDASKGDPMREIRSLVSRTVVAGIASKYGIEVTPILESETTRWRLYQRGDVSAIHTVLNNLRMISEDGLSWEQVLEFRRWCEKGDKSNF